MHGLLSFSIKTSKKRGKVKFFNSFASKLCKTVRNVHDMDLDPFFPMDPLQVKNELLSEQN